MAMPATSTKIKMGQEPCHNSGCNPILGVGSEGNYVFLALQANFAATQTANALAGAQLKQEFGNFGGKHLNHNDSERGYTSMITYTDVDVDEDPGVFIVGNLGVAIVLDNFIVINFFVCYPPQPMLDASTRLGFAVLPGNHLFVMPPEFTGPQYDAEPVITNLANWMSSSLYLTTPPLFLKFYYQTFCQMAHHFGHQAPRGTTIEVDYKKLSECFILTEENGKVHAAEFWELHPGSDAKSSEFDCTRKGLIAWWEKHKERHAQLMPAVVHRQRLAKASNQIVKALETFHRGRQDQTSRVAALNKSIQAKVCPDNLELLRFLGREFKNEESDVDGMGPSSPNTSHDNDAVSRFGSDGY
ncbi:hypothetical protein C8Q80DRAFT_1267456 [Daedaleopsis nitida]|nr:hypothetical protein C8Q80DRAFT_1267456 [Daedaleopsis nitida]